MHVTVLGADGFLGRALVTELAKQKDMTITAFSRFSSLAREDADSHPFNNLKNVTIVRGDFYNRDEVEGVIKDADYVFHLVSSTTPASSTKDPLVDIDTNLRSSVELFSLCSEHKIKKIIYFSSGGAVYGNTDDEYITESEHLAPVSPYGISKVAIEQYLEYFRQSRNLDYLVYRIANPYGPGQNIFGKQGVIPIFIHHLIDKKPITIYGDGEMVRDYIYIDDLVEMVCQTFNKKTTHRIYNLGSGNGTSINALIKALEASRGGEQAQKEYLPKPATFVNRNVLSIDRFINEFNINPKVALEEGIERTWKYVSEIT